MSLTRLPLKFLTGEEAVSLPQEDAKTLLDQAAWHPECDLLVTRAPKADRESLTALVKRFRDERATWGLKEDKE